MSTRRVTRNVYREDAQAQARYPFWSAVAEQLVDEKGAPRGLVRFWAKHRTLGATPAEPFKSGTRKSKRDVEAS